MLSASRTQEYCLHVRRTSLTAALGTALALAFAAPALAAPACTTENASVSGLEDGQVVPTGRSTAALVISGQERGEISNVTASVPSPGTAQTTLAPRGRVTLALSLPNAGTVTLTLTWDEQVTDPSGSTNNPVTCTQTKQMALRAVRPAAARVAGEGTAFRNGIAADFSFAACEASPLVAPVTVTVRHRLGAVRRSVRPPVPPAPTARSPKVVLALPKPCADRLPSRRVTLPGAGSVRIGGTSQRLDVLAARRARGRYSYAAHLRVEFAQPGYRTVRFDVVGFFSLSAGGKSSTTTVRRLR
jgi:hypothetical protein